METIWAIEPNALKTIQERLPILAGKTQGEIESLIASRGLRFHVQERIKVWATMGLSENGGSFYRQGSVAVVPLIGVLEKSLSLDSFLFGGTSTADARAQFNAAMDDEHIKAVVLAVDSPGGSVEGVPEFADDIYSARGVKPVFAQVEGQASSAAYWLASQAQKVFANRMDRVGSIGVYFAAYDVSMQAKRDGIKPVVIASGALKGLGIPGTEITADQVNYLQKQVDAYAAEFMGAIKRGRGMPKEKRDAMADGREIFGHEALEMGMVDKIAGLGETLSGLVQGKAGRMAAENLNADSLIQALDLDLALEA
jgi:capsid assembly protease